LHKNNDNFCMKKKSITFYIPMEATPLWKIFKIITESLSLDPLSFKIKKVGNYYYFKIPNRYISHQVEIFKCLQTNGIKCFIDSNSTSISIFDFKNSFLSLCNY
jgi:hypothetical protein